ncbi:MAG: hypothetical protein H7296_03955 [Bacteroidia bacterium]|nr:hypothetical protein [Bacteroidia bacterium]
MKGAEDKFKMQWGRIPGGKMNDMKLVQMFIKWNNTFNEENPAKQKAKRFEPDMDETKSKE